MNISCRTVNRLSAGRVPTVVLIVLASLVGGLLIALLFTPRKPKAVEGGSPEFTAGASNRLVPDFQLIDQEGKPVSRDDLKGSIWLTGFVYSRCHTQCPLVSATMAQLRDDLPSDIKLVSFSVDPRHDTPEVLAQYAANFQADPSRWKFLTGDRDQIYRVIQEGFLVSVEENADPRTMAEDLVVHSNRIVIVDREGIARSGFLSSDPEGIEQLKRTVLKMREESR